MKPVARDVAFEAIDDGVLVLDEQDRIVDANPAAAALFGVAVQDMVGRAASEPCGRWPGGPLRVGESLVKLEDRQVRASVGTLSAGMRGHIVLLVDVTDLHAAQTALEERVRMALFDSEVSAVLMGHQPLSDRLGGCAEVLRRHLAVELVTLWTLSVDGVWLDVAAWAGHSPVDAPRQRVRVGEHWVGRVAQRRRPEIRSPLNSPRLRGDAGWAAEAGLLAFTGFPMCAGEELLGVLGMYGDTPLPDWAIEALDSVAARIAVAIDRDRADRALRLSEDRTRSVLEHMMAGLVVLTEQDVIETANPAAESILGFERGGLIGRSMSDIAPSLAGNRAALANTMLGGTTEAPGCRADGSTVACEWAFFQVHSLGGRRIAATFDDISGRLESERLKSEFMATVSHELRTPLSAIQATLRLLALGILGETEVKDALAMADRNALRLASLIDNLLDFERLSGGRMEMVLDAIPVAHLFAEACARVKAFADERDARLEIGSAQGLVRADEQRLVQVLVNLISNAVKFSPPGGRIRLTAEPRAAFVELRVADQGAGIPKPVKDVIFERFRQIDASDARAQGGAGLGLAIARAIVEAHGGQLGVESEEGHGATFWLRIPALDSHEPPESQHPTDPTEPTDPPA